MLTVRLEDVTRVDEALGELFEVLGTVLRFAELRDAYIQIADADDNCPLVQELRRNNVARRGYDRTRKRYRNFTSAFARWLLRRRGSCVTEHKGKPVPW